MKLNRLYSGDADSMFLISVFKEGFTLLRKLDYVIESLENYLENPNSYDIDEGLIFLDAIGDVLDLDVHNLDTFYVNSLSGYQDLKRRISDAFDNYYKFRDLVQGDYDAFVPVEFKNLEVLLKYSKSCYGHLSLFLVRQFEMEELTLENFNDKVEFSLQNACKDLGINNAESVLKVRGFLLEKVNAYKPKIEIFDEYPELEDKFYEKVGQEFYDSDYLTYEDVINVIEEKLDPEDLKKRLDEATRDIQESDNK